MERVLNQLDRCGQGIVEYALALAFVLVLVLVVINFVDIEKNLRSVFQAVNQILENVISYIGS